MKQLISSAVFLLLCFCISCNNPKTTVTTENSQAEKNLAKCNVINKAIESGDVSALDSVIASDAVDHAGERGDIKGRDSIKAELAKIHTMGNDMKMEKIREIADDDYVYQWMRFTGTLKQPMGNMPAGSKYDVTAIEVTEFKDGMAVEHWEFMEPKEIMKMMGGEQKMDTTGKKMKK